MESPRLIPARLTDSVLALALGAGFLSSGCAPPRMSSSLAELRFGIAQLGVEARLSENCSKMLAFIHQAKAQGCRLVVFPESALSGKAADPTASPDP